MAKKKLGMGTVEINKKFKDMEEAEKYAKRLISHIRYVCKKNANKGWYAQAFVVSSNLKKDVSTLRYEITGERGRPKKVHDINNVIANGWYKGNYTTDWHLHILLLSKPSYMFRNEIKAYIDKNWIDIPKAYETEPFDLKKVDSKNVYKKTCNIFTADYFIKQSEQRWFCDCNNGNEEPLKYNLKQYYNEYLKADSGKRRLCREHILKQFDENEYLEKERKIMSKFNEIQEYFLNITKEQDEKDKKEFMNKVRINKIAEAK